MTGPPEWARFQNRPRPPPALVSAVRRPREGGGTLVLDAGGQNVIVVLDSGGGEANLIWAFIQKYLTGRKAIRM